MRARDISVVQVLCTVSFLCLVQRVSAQGTLPGGDCTTSDDCYDSHSCLGGKCCSFTETMHATTKGIYSACIACGGAVGYYSSDWSTALQYSASVSSGTEGVDYQYLQVAGACISCEDTPDQFTRLGYNDLENGEFQVSMMPSAKDSYREGICANLDMCSSSEYLHILVGPGADDSNAISCASRSAAGSGCSVDEGWKCESGLCGHEHCCESSTCSSGVCDATGACVSKSLPGGDCTTSDDCYDSHSCLGGKCCSFTETMHATTKGIYSACIACGGAVGYYSSDWSTALQYSASVSSGTEGVDYQYLQVAGACISCEDTPDQFTRLGYNDLENGEFQVSMMPSAKDSYREGICANLDMCSSSEYLHILVGPGADDSNAISCASRSAAGSGCSVDEGWKCESGLCGHEHCCESSTCSSGVCDATGACVSKSLPGGDCTTSDDCYDSHSCLGGKCCSFTETMHATTKGIYSACIACGGAVGYYSSDWSTALQYSASVSSGTEGVDYQYLQVAGACISCEDTPDQFTRLGYNDLENGEFQVSMMPSAKDSYREGICANLDMCSSSEYLHILVGPGADDSNAISCASRSAAGSGCSVDEGWKCESGLCGHEHCCESSTCSSGVCDATGECFTNSNSGDEASDVPSPSPSTVPPEDASAPSPSEGSDTYPGTAGCELVCEGDDVTQTECDHRSYCEWDLNRCWSSVGDQPCPCTDASDCPAGGECVDTQCVPAPESEPASGSVSDERVAASIDALVDTISDPDDKRKAKLLAVAVAAGATVPRLKMMRNAASEDAACEDAFAKMQVSPDVGICEVLRTHVRRLLAGNLNYDLSVLLDPTEVDETELQDALSNLQTAGVSATNDRVEPAVELAEIPGMDADALASFEAAVEEAATEEEEEESAAEERAAESASPPPPSPPQPPRVLVADDESGAERRRLGVIFAVVAVQGVAAAMG